MPKLRVATWNINSVRLRIDLVRKLLAEHKPDVLCLQETKTQDEFFPHDAFEQMGYKHRHIYGMKSYNGVAIVSRKPFADTFRKDWYGKQDARHIYVEMATGEEIHNCYVPAGGDIPDPDANEKFAHKLGFVDAQAAWWKNRKDAKSKILVGDLNIAPMEHDVWSHKQMLDVVSHTPVEVEKFTAWQKAHKWVDAMRHFVPEEEKLYSWWSYRAADWEASNRGRRLDHIWVTPDMTSSLKKMQVIREARGWEPKPSDHVPVIVDIG